MSSKFDILLHVLAYTSIKYACRYTHLAAVFMNIIMSIARNCTVYTVKQTPFHWYSNGVDQRFGWVGYY